MRRNKCGNFAHVLFINFNAVEFSTTYVIFFNKSYKIKQIILNVIVTMKILLINLLVIYNVDGNSGYVFIHQFYDDFQEITE